MSIINTELVWRKPAEDSDNSSNGGRMTATAITSGVKNNIFPDVLKAERTAGVLRYRKRTLHVANSEDLTLVQGRIMVENYTASADSVTIFPATATDTQAAVTGSEQKYGCGQLDVDANVTDTTIDVLTEDAALDYFKSGMTVRISDQATIDGAGNEQYVVLTSDATYVGDVATLNFTGDPLSFAFTAVNTRVMSVIEAGNIEGAIASVVVTSSLGTFVHATTPIVPHNIGGIEQNWTLTFTNSATQVNVTGDTVGDLGDFSVGTDVSPTNSDFASAFFTLPIAGLGGTFVDGDTITFTQSPAAYDVWISENVPAATPSLTGNQFTLAVDGESA